MDKLAFYEYFVWRRNFKSGFKNNRAVHLNFPFFDKFCGFSSAANAGMCYVFVERH